MPAPTPPLPTLEDKNREKRWTAVFLARAALSSATAENCGWFADKAEVEWRKRFGEKEEGK